MGDENKFIRDIKLYIALWENAARNLRRSNVIESIEKGADVNVRFANNANNTPLHIAVEKGDKDIVSTLLSYGAKANIPNDAGKTALQLAKEQSECSDIVEILIEHEERKVNDNRSQPFSNKALKTTKYEYKKRPGTANVRGQLYETKLLTTVYLRALRCKQILEFYLGTNVDEIGGLDDVCLRLTTKTKNIAIFLQAKYRHDIVKGRLRVQELWEPNGDFSLLKYYDSYTRIRKKFHSNSTDVLFRGRYEDIIPYFVIYTTVKDEIKKIPKKAAVDNMVHDLLGTGENQNVFQFICEEQHVNALMNLKLLERVKNMGKKLIKILLSSKNDDIHIFSDINIRNFHVILAQKVIKVTDVNSEGCRTGTFREEFFHTEDTLLVELRKTLYAEIVKYNNLSVEETEASMHKISIEPTADNISYLIESVLVYNNNTSTLKLATEANGKWYSYQNILESMQVAKSDINEAFQIAGRRKLKKLVFKLPAAFGNIDMTINKKKINRRLEYLADKICVAIKSAADEEGNVIIQEGVFSSDKKLESGILDVNGGITGAVGNLFVSDNDTKLKFNLDIKSLGENSRKLHLILKERLKDLRRYRFDIHIEDFPRLSMKATDFEKRHARDFLKNLYFYTFQAKEENLEEIATKELQGHKAMSDFSKLESRIRSNAIFLKIHNEIQIWWMMDQAVYYLTRNMEIFETIFSYFKNKGLLTFLNILYMKDSYNTRLEFKSDIVDVLSVCICESHDQRIIVVLTEAYMLTSLKLIQLFKDNDKYYIFIDIDYIYRVLPNCFDTIFAELSETVIPIVIIVCNDTSKSTYRIVDMIRGCVSTKIILLTTSYDKKYEYVVINDDKINLCNLTNESQQKILQTQFLYQGVEVTFAEVFDQAKHLIGPMILQKIMRNEQIVLGQTLESSVYKDMKNYYVPRVLEPNMTISSDTCEILDENYIPPFENENKYYTFCQQFSPSTLVDHLPQSNSNGTNSNFVLILDAPGMGKSTLLTHLSIETKQRYPKIWIQRINLAEHTKQFYEWQENHVEIDHMEVLKFVCSVAICKDVVKDDVCNSNVDIQLQIVDDILNLIGCGENFPLKLLEFNTFLNCFEERNIVFLFDGFDEIVPHYKNTVIHLLKCLAHNENASNIREELQTGFCVWITSRPYNDLKITLEGEFGKSYTLLPFSYYDTYVFVDKYMKRNLNLTMLGQEQLMNIDGFFEYMKRFDLRSKKQPSDTLNVTNVQLHGIYMAAVEYLKNEIKLNSLSDSLAYVKDWDFQEDVLMVWNLFKDEDAYTNATILSGVPLNLYIAIHYFLSQIKDTTIVGAEQRIQKWDLNTNTFAFYERFLEAKLKRRFEEKNRMNIYNPDVKMTCEREMKAFRDKHMQLAFYTVFEKDVFTDAEFSEVQNIVKSMEIGNDKNGLVDRIINGKPKFIHYTFAEYFAVEHIFEILKYGEVEKQVKVLDCILNNMVLCKKNGFQVMFDLKLKCTPGFVNEINNSFLIYQHIFRTLVQQSTDMSANMSVDYSKSDILPYLTVLDIAVNEELMHFAEFLVDAMINVVDESNISGYVLIIEKGTSLPLLVDKTYNTTKNEITAGEIAKKNLMNKIVDGVTRVDAKKVYDILNSLWLKCRPPF